MSNPNNAKIGEKLLQKNVENLEPIGVAYNIPSELIESFVVNYLKDTKSIDGLGGVRLKVVKGGDMNKVRLGAFFYTTSKDISTPMCSGEMLELLADKMPTDGYMMTDKLKKALIPLCKKLELNPMSKNVVAIELNIFSVLGMMLAVDRTAFRLIITAVEAVSNTRAVLTVIKKLAYQDTSSEKDYDQFNAMMDRMNEDY
jgi:hypothetical protein